MVPTTRNLLHHDGKSSSNSCYHPGKYCAGIAAQLEASAVADVRQDHRRPSRSPRLDMADDKAATAAGAGDDDGDWLQLGLAATASSSSSGDNNSTDPAPPPNPMELDSFAYDNKRNARTMRPPPLFPLPLRSYQAYGSGRYRPAAATGSMSAPLLPPFRSSGDAIIRVISPPRPTEEAGLWLTLRAAPNQVREPILPQIPKSYLRIKDINMKVEVVIKYLAEKLGIARSHQCMQVQVELELTCRGQPLPPFLLVKHVRDSIWYASAPREDDQTPRRSSPAGTTTTDHVMTLFYSTSRNPKLILHL